MSVQLESGFSSLSFPSAMATSLSTADFLAPSGVILDVRSPAEYAQGHIPGAVRFPLFTNEERAQVGICYKQQGRNQAVELGFAIVGPKLAGFIAQAKELAPNRQVRIHCWRGGMRSESVAWALEMAGFQVSLLTGGYKAFRRWVLESFAEPRSLLILGGMTGTGKTDILHALADQGEQVLDLEHLANHRGSSYGNLGLPPQPTNEQFENEIALRLAALPLQRPVWIEAESKRIGICRIPEALFQQMERSPILEVVRPQEERLSILVQGYGVLPVEDLVTATERIRKRLGGLRTQQAVDLIQQGNLSDAVRLILDYYDKTYTYDLQRRNVPIFPVEVGGRSAWESATLLREEANRIWQADPTLEANLPFPVHLSYSS